MTVLQEMLNELRAKTHSDEGRPIVNVYREIRECLKQAAIERGEWMEDLKPPEPSMDDTRDMTVAQLYAAQEVLLEAKAKIEKIRNGELPPKMIEAAQGSVEITHVFCFDVG